MSDKPKMCFCLDQFIMGGVEKIALVLLSELKKHYDISLIVEHEIKDEYFLNFFKEQRIPIYCTYNEKPKSALKRKYWKLIGRYLNRLRYKELFINADIIIDYKNLWWADFLKNIKTPKITVFHASFPVFQKWGSIKKINSYDKMICLTDNFKKDFIKTYPNDKEKIIHIYNPVDFDEIKKQSLEISISPQESYFVAVQRLSQEKDVQTIINAFNIFSKKHKNVSLCIVGDGPDRTKLKTLAEDNKHIIFTGQIDSPYHLIKNSEALILSSTKEVGEGLPTTLLESQILETLAVSSDVQSGPSEILMGGKAGVLFEVGAEQELANIMMDIYEKKLDKQPLIRTARENLFRFDKNQIVPKFLNLIKEVVENHQ